jgi:hypothetical protein
MSQPHVRAGTYEQSSQGSSWNNEQISREHKNLWAILIGEHKHQSMSKPHRGARDTMSKPHVSTEPMSNRTGKHKINEQASQIGTCMGFPLLKFAQTCIYLPQKTIPLQWASTADTYTEQFTDIFRVLDHRLFNLFYSNVRRALCLIRR